jgi:hypothetical protein
MLLVVGIHRHVGLHERCHILWQVLLSTHSPVQQCVPVGILQAHSTQRSHGLASSLNDKTVLKVP